MYNAAILLPFVSICLHHQAFYKMFRHLLRKKVRSIEIQDDKEFLCEIINFHSTVKGWFLESAQVYSPHLMIQLICNMFILAVTVFQLDLVMIH